MHLCYLKPMHLNWSVHVQLQHSLFARVSLKETNIYNVSEYLCKEMRSHEYYLLEFDDFTIQIMIR